jgi:hypothetical protein
MRMRTLIRSLIVVGLGWLFLTGPRVFTDMLILRNASGYRRAVFVVTGSNCIGGQVTRDSRGRTTTSTRFCFLEGEVVSEGDSNRVAEEMSVGGDLPADRPPGTRLPVVYNPALRSYTINYLNLRLLPDERGAEPMALARARLFKVAWVVLVALGTLVAVNLVLRWGVRRLSRPPRQLAVDLGGGHAITGAVLFSQGLTLVLAQIPDPALGGVVFGAVLAGAGVPFLIRRFAVFSKDDARMTRGRHFFSLVLRQEERGLPAVGSVILRREQSNLVLALDGPGGTETLGAPATLDDARRTGTDLAAFFGVDLADQVPSEAESPAAIATRRRVAAARWRRRLVRLSVLVLVVGSGVLVVEREPGVRLSAARTVLEPFGYLRQLSPLRQWALDRLERDPSPAALLELLRVLNTIDAQTFPEIAADVDSAAARAAGVAPPTGDSRDATVRAVNEWAARRLGGTVDGNGGVFGFIPVVDRFRSPIDAIAGTDPQSAWLAWNHFAAGDLTTPEQFLWAVGPALGDRRPICFVITASGASFEGQPELIESRPEVLAHTVGESIALRLWLKKGVGDDRFPDDFWAWWKEWARQHRLPPQPELQLRSPGGDPAEGPGAAGGQSDHGSSSPTSDPPPPRGASRGD